MNFDIIEDARIRNKMSVKELCEKANINRSTYYNIQANPDSVTFSVANRIVNALDLTVIEKSKIFT